MIQSDPSRGRDAYRRSALTAAALALSAVVLTACGGGEGSGAEASSDGSAFVEGSGVITSVPVGDRLPAPELTGETTHDEPIALADYAGQVLVLNVWGSWCAPCRAEAPYLAAVSEDLADQDVQFVGINVRDHDPANARAFDRRFDIAYPSFYDPKGRLILEFPANTLSPQGIPSTLVVDRDGNIAARAVKALTEEELRGMIEPVLAEGDTAPGDGSESDGDAGSAAEGAADDA
ncbi:TlpA family protein disulfide reductase [Streptomyces bohaiensis]|uniref:TlpA family protein disulfide reductase n=1 Tax=Streptomyces bohaiensis TaxID=1431344 RepID=A0ABX1CDD7_9ACTN|nr:TlpA disulfide reductase family protein [Streptomyces bohaiensis]NJQ17116.1 TlpA family protein disulfide reductase [Streptomyces bohaiensis]